jgi:putative toxin-antitoxin system antitoxin component (TIGR02293 family)
LTRDHLASTYMPNDPLFWGDQMQISSINVSSDDLMGFISQIKTGLPISTFERLKDKLGVSERLLMAAVDISKRTLRRRKNDGRLSSAESEKVVRIGKIFDKAAQVFGNDESLAAKWFREPARGLAGKTPLEMVETEIGAQEVYALLVRIEHGVFPG